MYTLKRRRHEHACLIGIYCFCVLSVINMVTCYESTCDESVGHLYPRVSFCSEKHFANKVAEIVIDSFDVSNNSTVKTCTCVAKAVYPGIDKIVYSDIRPPSSAQRNCGSSIVFSQNFSQLSKHSCVVNGTLNIDSTKTFNIMLEKDYHSSNTQYCFLVIIKTGNIMNITCNDVTFWNSIMESTEYHTTYQSTGGIVNDSDGIHVEENTGTNKQSNEQDLGLIFIVIGCVVVLVCLVVTGIILFFKIRKRFKASQTTYDDLHVPADNNTSHYNSLFVLSDNNIQQHQYENSLNHAITGANVGENSYYEIDFNNTTQKSNVMK